MSGVPGVFKRYAVVKEDMHARSDATETHLDAVNNHF